MDSPSTNPSPGALRLTFRYDGDHVELVSSQRVEMLLPPSHQLDLPKPQAGFSFEVRDSGGKALYRRVIHPPIRTSVEVFEEDGSIRREPVDKPSGIFVLLVPELDQGDSLVLLGSPEGAEAARVREIARIQLQRPPGRAQS